MAGTRQEHAGSRLSEDALPVSSPKDAQVEIAIPEASTNDGRLRVPKGENQ